MINQQQAGFTLVELMVAMVVGAIIILGAGQLFLTTFQTFRMVDDLSRKQESLVFATTTLVDRIRKEGVDGYEVAKDEREYEDVNYYYCVLQDIVKKEPVVDLARVNEDQECPSLIKDGSDSVITLSIGDCRDGESNSKEMCDKYEFFVTEREKIIDQKEEGS